MELNFTVTIVYDDDDDAMAGEATPDPEAISKWICAGMAEDGFTSADRVEVMEP